MKLLPQKSHLRAAALLLFLSANCSLSQVARAYDWLQFEFNPEKTGDNTSESIVNASNVSGLKLLFDVALPGADNPDGAPVLLTGVTTPSGVKDLVFVQGEHGHLTAFDAHTGATVWSRGAITGTSYGNTAPAIDPNRQFIYYSGNDGMAHKINVGDGTEVTSGGWPASTGGGKAGPQLTIATAANGHTYLYCANLGTGTGLFGKGHETVIDLANASEHIFNNCASEQPDTYSPTTSTTGCRPWSRSTIYDPSLDRVYYMAANNSGTNWVAGHVWRESWLALAPDGSTRVDSTGGWPVDSYTPTNWSSLVGSDQDIGTGGMGLLPVGLSSKYPHLGVTPGKDKNIRILNLADMSGQGGPGHLGGELSIYNESTLGLMRANCCVWPNPANSDVWVFVPGNNGIAGFKVAISSAGNPSLSLQWTITGNWTTSAFVANNVLYAARGGGENTGSQSIHEVSAIDPTTGKVLWSGAIDEFHWASPILANGILYMADGNSGGFSGPGGHLRAWGLGTPPPPPVADPTFSPAAGTYTTAQSVTISTSTSGASIRYTTDGSAPSETHGTVYSGPVSVSSGTVAFQAIGYESGFTDSNVVSASYTINTTLPPAAAPVFSPGAGTYATAQSVTMTSTTSGASIRYTTDGSTPSEINGTLYSGPVSISATTTLQAIAYESGMIDSTVTSGTYTIGSASSVTINDTDSGIVYTGTWTHSAGRGLGDYQDDVHYTKTNGDSMSYTFTGTGIAYITEKNTDEGNVDVYMDGVLQQTVDCTNATRLVQQTVYTASGLASGTHTLKLAKASGTFMLVDALTIFNSTQPQVAAPVFSPAGGTYGTAQNVTITSATSGASIRYTTDGSTPSETAGTLYSGPVSISVSPTTLQAIAYESGMTDSTVTSATYTIGSTLPTFTFEAESLSPVGSGATVSISNDANASGGVVEFLNSTAAGQSITFTTPAMPAGTYQVQLRYKTNKTRGIHNLTVDGIAVGGTLDQYASTQAYLTHSFGNVTLTSSGAHTIVMTVTGKNSASTAYYLTADSFTFTGQ